MKASVIIPAYNAAQTVEKAIRSVADTPPPFPYEILVVDDGSSDETVALLRSLAEKIHALRFLTQENAGPSAARNLGMREARGEYLLFLDSDDVFLPHAVEEAVALCEREEAEILIGSYRLVSGGSATPYQVPALGAKEPFWEHLSGLYQKNMLNQVWAKVFAKSLIDREKLSFPPCLWGEDRLFFFDALKKARGIAVTELCLVDYIQNEGSLITRFLPSKPALCREIHRKILALAREKGVLTDEDERIYSYMYIKSLLSCLSTLSSPSCCLSPKEKTAYLRTVTRQKELKEANKTPRDAGLSFFLLAALLRKGGLAGAYLASWLLAAASRLAPGLVRKSKHIYNRKDRAAPKTKK